MKRFLLGFLLSVGMFASLVGIAGIASAASVAPHVVATPFLRVAPGGHPSLSQDGLSAKFAVRYACASSNGFTETSSTLTVVIAQGSNALTGTMQAECDGLAHNVPGGMLVSGPIALHRGSAQIAGALTQQEINLSFTSNTESSTLLDGSTLVTLV